MAQTSDIKRKVLSTIRAFKMIDPGERVLVAFSGGPDSTALLHILKRLGNELKINLVAAHFHHGLRGLNADRDATRSREIARSLNIPFIIKKGDVRSYKKKRKISLEMAARELRYHFLEETAREQGAHKIATAHTADDQAEEVLLSLIRGSGPLGLAGIPPMRNSLYIRPLISCRKGEVEQYLEEQNISFCRDETNLDLKYTRNRLRLRVLPLLEKDFNPRVVEALNKTALILRDEEDFWQGYVREKFEQTAREEPEGFIKLRIPELLSYPRAVQRRLVRFAIEKLTGRVWGIGFKRIEEIRELCRSSKTGGTIHLHGGIRIEKQDNLLVIGKHLPEQEKSFSLFIPSPGTYRIHEPIRGQLIIAVLHEIPYDLQELGPYETLMDADKVSFPLKLRSRKAGDRFMPLGLKGTKKLQDLFVDRKVPRSQRNRVPILEDSEKIIWVVGHQIDERVKLSPSTGRYLLARWERIPGDNINIT